MGAIAEQNTFYKPRYEGLRVTREENSRIIQNHIHGTPDLVIEILSNSTRERDLGVKAARYLSCGIKEYWIADPVTKEIQVWVNNKNGVWQKLTGKDLKSEVLPGLIIKAAEIFWNRSV